jgi:hypothetical protein
MRPSRQDEPAAMRLSKRFAASAERWECAHRGRMNLPQCG